MFQEATLKFLLLLDALHTNTCILIYNCVPVCVCVCVCVLGSLRDEHCEATKPITQWITSPCKLKISYKLITTGKN
jgi:hypothetical protein